MIPLQLTLKNFLSYRDATLDFRGLHTACICGANGAGKSSLLEAITWVVWGKSRAATEDDVIHGGAKNVRIDFDFSCHNQTYRIIRSRSRGRSSSLEFQVATTGGKFRSITAKGVKATQQEIISCLKLDYDTFINSAYLRQGRADEFMIRRPSDRKQILADLLKLHRYEELATQAKDTAKEYKGKIEQLEQSLIPLQEQLGNRESISQEIGFLRSELGELQAVQDESRKELEKLRTLESYRRAWEEQLSLQQTQYQNLIQDCDRLEKDILSVETQQQELTKILEQETEIVTGYNTLLSWQEQETEFAAKFAKYQEAQQQKQELEKQLLKQRNELNLQIRQTQTRLESIEQQEQEIKQVLAKEEKIAAAVVKFQKSREKLEQLDKIQQYVSPLLQQKHNLQTEIERTQARLTAKLDQLQISTEHLSEQIAKVPQIRNAVLTVDAKIEVLDKKKVYQKRVEEKGLERKEFRHRLQDNQRSYEKQWQELQQKLEMLSTPDAICPLCEQGLDEHHRHQVINKTNQQQEEIQAHIWTIREQLAVCEKELQLLRHEYKAISQEINAYDSLQQQLGQLEAQLEATEDTYKRLQEIKQEKSILEESLENGDYAQHLQLDLQQIEAKIAELNYDEKTHALVREEFRNWQWAEIKQAKIEDAKKRQEKLSQQKPELLASIERLQQDCDRLNLDSEIQQQIHQVEQYITELGYEQSQHQNLLQSLRQGQSWHLQYQQLQQAKEQYPQLQRKHQELTHLLQERLTSKTTTQEQLNSYLQQQATVSNHSKEIQELEQKIYQRRQQLDDLISRKGSLEQALVQIDNIQDQHSNTYQELEAAKRKYRVYQELGQAFGKNGIQALTIENILPQLEAETNQILARLTGNQFHVQFITQKASKNSSKKKTKLIDTLDIIIADSRGTRPYETYSGGEAFRINFSIRLALAKLLAQRAGTSLQMLIVDEGFGTQDAEGCDRLVAAINAIASDFNCILTVTHMPQFKEAFQTRIEVYKGENGSFLRVAS
ncbi:MAG: exonuclease subunit SbcC [Xenococcaceae cyanobacterium MO_167.B27]|nr:exonuclease subunit SbcC [Xenococcaceae cyanobacterium MO_167.B27]